MHFMFKFRVYLEVPVRLVILLQLCNLNMHVFV